MTTILVFCILAAAAWLAMSLLGRQAGAGPKDSVEDFSRALSALSAQPTPRRRPAARSRPVPARTRSHRSAPGPRRNLSSR